MIDDRVGRELSRAKKYALHLLKYRSRSKKEIERRLSFKGFNKEVIDKILDYLENLGYLNDERLARDFIYEKFKRGFGRKKIIFELTNKFFLDKDLIESILRELDLDYKARIKELISKKIGYRRDKILRYLLQRGFEYDQIQEVIDEYEGFTT